jgi:ribosomal protein L16/L10AE
MSEPSQTREWDKESIQSLLSTSNVAVERALVALYKRQTRDEQHSGTATHANGIGFSGADAEFYSKLAVQVQENGNRPWGKRLTVRQLEAARRGIGKYWKQLLEEIAIKRMEEMQTR